MPDEEKGSPGVRRVRRASSGGGGGITFKSRTGIKRKRKLPDRSKKKTE